MYEYQIKIELMIHLGGSFSNVVAAHKRSKIESRGARRS